MNMLISGIILFVLGAILQAYCRLDTKDNIARPILFDTSLGLVLKIGWIILFLAGIVLIFIANWALGIFALVVYWGILRLLFFDILKKLF
jgi:hypothetical protein